MQGGFFLSLIEGGGEIVIIPFSGMYVCIRGCYQLFRFCLFFSFVFFFFGFLFLYGCGWGLGVYGWVVDGGGVVTNLPFSSPFFPSCLPFSLLFFLGGIQKT